MRCPNCQNETRSEVRLCLQCDWRAPDAEEALSPAPPPTGVPREVIAGVALIALALVATVVSYASAVAHGGGEYGIFLGGVGGGLILILNGLRERRARHAVAALADAAQEVDAPLLVTGVSAGSGAVALGCGCLFLACYFFADGNTWAAVGLFVGAVVSFLWRPVLSTVNYLEIHPGHLVEWRWGVPRRIEIEAVGSMFVRLSEPRRGHGDDQTYDVTLRLRRGSVLRFSGPAEIRPVIRALVDAMQRCMARHLERGGTLAFPAGLASDSLRGWIAARRGGGVAVSEAGLCALTDHDPRALGAGTYRTGAPTADWVPWSQVEHRLDARSLTLRLGSRREPIVLTEAAPNLLVLDRLIAERRQRHAAMVS